MKNLTATTYIKASKKKASNNYVIYVKLSDDFTSITFSVGESISKERWRITRKLKTPRSSDEKRIKNEIADLISKISDEELFLMANGVNPTPRLIKDHLTNKKPKTSVVAVFDEFLEGFERKVKAGKRSYQTYQKYEKVKEFFLEFLKLKYGISDMPLISLDYSICDAYVDFLSDNKNNCNNTLVKHIWNIKGVWNFAISYGYLSKDP